MSDIESMREDARREHIHDVYDKYLQYECSKCGVELNHEDRDEGICSVCQEEFEE